MNCYYHFLLFIILSVLPAEAAREMLIVVSESGNGDYEVEFKRQAKIWQNVASEANIKHQTIGLDAETDFTDLELLEKVFVELPKKGDDLWLVWIGHGTFDGNTANFNLRGKDIAPELLTKWVKPFERRLIILNLFSASAPFIPKLKGKNRIIIGANRGAGQRNYSRFGENFANALTHDKTDLDLDGSLSLLEISLTASAATRAFYDDAQRVIQEHAVIDDNGDGLATSLDTFEGFRANKLSKEAETPDGLEARYIYLDQDKPDSLLPKYQEKRAEIEVKINLLRARKSEFDEDKYYKKLEVLLLEMANLYSQK